MILFNIKSRLGGHGEIRAYLGHTYHTNLSPYNAATRDYNILVVARARIL